MTAGKTTPPSYWVMATRGMSMFHDVLASVVIKRVTHLWVYKYCLMAV